VEAGEHPYVAALSGSREIGFTILSMTASLAAVFIPILLMGGIVGRLLHEFAVTIVIAILISGVVSVTLTPMLCSRLLKPAAREREIGGGFIYRVGEASFNVLQRRYAPSLVWTPRPRTFIWGLFVEILAAPVTLSRTMPADFLP